MTTSYTQLITEIQNYADRDDLAAEADLLLDKAEFKIAMDVFPEGCVRYASGVLTIGSRIMTKPVRFLSPLSLNILVSNVRIPLKSREYDYLINYWPNSTLQGQPDIYGDLEGDFLILAPTPDLAYPFELRYRERLTPLSIGNQTNFITDNYPNLISYACFLEAAIFLKNAVDQAKWEKKYEEEKTRVDNIENMKLVEG